MFRLNDNYQVKSSLKFGSNFLQYFDIAYTNIIFHVLVFCQRMFFHSNKDSILNEIII